MTRVTETEENLTAGELLRRAQSNLCVGIAEMVRIFETGCGVTVCSVAIEKATVREGGELSRPTEVRNVVVEIKI